MYKILVEKDKNGTLTPNLFWSKIYGCFCNEDQATTFTDFDAAQPTVKQLRKENADFYIYAIEVR